MGNEATLDLKQIQNLLNEKGLAALQEKFPDMLKDADVPTRSEIDDKIKEKLERLGIRLRVRHQRNKSEE